MIFISSLINFHVPEAVSLVQEYFEVGMAVALFCLDFSKIMICLGVPGCAWPRLIPIEGQRRRKAY